MENATITKITSLKINTKCELTLHYKGVITGFNIYLSDKTTLIGEGENDEENKTFKFIIEDIYNDKGLWFKDLTENSLLAFGMRFNFFNSHELKANPEGIKYDIPIPWYEVQQLKVNNGIKYAIKNKEYEVIERENDIKNIEYDRGFTDGFLIGKSL